MAKKGEDKKQKSISAEKVRALQRKANKWTIRSIPGPYCKKNSVPLGFLLRELLKAAKNLRETKLILNSGKIRVNGIVRRDYRFPVGLFDIVNIEGKKAAIRVLVDNKGRITTKEINENEKQAKLCKITGKKAIKGGFIQLETNDGSSIRERKTALRVGDSIKLELPSKKIVESYELKKGNLAYIISGTHAGTIAKISEITESAMNKAKLITLEHDKHSFQTTDRNIFVVGGKKPAIEIGE